MVDRETKKTLYYICTIFPDLLRAFKVVLSEKRVEGFSEDFEGGVTGEDTGIPFNIADCFYFKYFGIAEPLREFY
jgi:hypothetical protein